MKRNWKTLAVCILIPLAVGAVAGLLSMSGMENFMTMNQPPLSPPAWVFPVAWTILYTLMGISSYLIYVSESGIPQNGNSNISVSKNTKENNGKSKALSTYGYQLLVNFLWPVFFHYFLWYFYLHLYSNFHFEEYQVH